MERERERERDRGDRGDRGGRRRRRYDDDDEDDMMDDPEEYFERNRDRRGGRGGRRPPHPDFDREDRMRDRYRRPPMDDLPHEEYRRRRDRRDTGDREKHFDEMKRRMQERENSGDHYKTTKDVQQAPVIAKYSLILWGEEHPFLSHWISQVANMAPNGVLANDWMRREASHISINVDDFKNNMGVDLSTEQLYTGYIEYEQRLKDYDIHITNKFVPYIACRPKRRLEEEEPKKEEEKKSDL